MPTYEYACSDCGYDFEVFQKFTDKALTECPKCKNPLHKVYSPVGVVFKGSGFYATDNRTKGKTSASIPAASSSHEEGSAAKSESSSSSTASTDKPASAPVTSAASEAKVA
ncbi:FmdB family zinc ribbon protein [Propionibacterium sp.]|uniref:FmdB family zinc ribbon protein n=1 Tax=Propionibacterium sp. TaxID=1977903 RepID=UPI0039EB0BBE